MIASLVAWGRRRAIRRLGRKVARLKLRRAKDQAYLTYWTTGSFGDKGDGYRPISQANLEADLYASIAVADASLRELEPRLLALEKEELKIGLWQAEKEQARMLACFVLNADPAPRYKAMAEAVLQWANPTQAGPR